MIYYKRKSSFFNLSILLIFIFSGNSFANSISKISNSANENIKKPSGTLSIDSLKKPVNSKRTRAKKTKNQQPQIELNSLTSPISINNLVSSTLNQPSSKPTTNFLKNPEDKNQIITNDFTKKTNSTKSKSITVGNYIGIDFINTSLRYKNIEYNPYYISDYTLPKQKNSFGIKYFYAINYKRFFLAPELFFEYNNIKKQFDGQNEVWGFDNERLYQNSGYKFMKIHRIYGGKINFGYDITPVFSSFLFAGLSKIYYSSLGSPYELNTYDPDNPNANLETRYDVIKATGKDPHSVLHKSRNVPFFGFGSKIKLSNHFLLNAEYLIYNNFIGKTNGYEIKEFSSVINRSDYGEFNNKLRVFKLGLLYNF